MQVRVFKAKDMATGLKMVKEALGPNALILSTKTVRTGTMGVLGKPMMEITAAVDSNWQPPSSPSRHDQRQVSRTKRSRGKDLTYQDVWQQQMESPPVQETEQNTEALHTELEELRSIVKGLSSQFSPPEEIEQQHTDQTPEKKHSRTKQTRQLETLIDYLGNYGVHEETAKVVGRFVVDNLKKKGRSEDETDLMSALKEALAKLFVTETFFQEPWQGQRILSLVGPTGVGKTTTLAKIAAHFLGRIGGKIGLITIDTYRIAAVEQLKVYAEIMYLPIQVVMNPSELRQAFAQFRTCDLILIDTAGSSPKDESSLQELIDFLSPHPGIEISLLLNAASREREIEETIRRFSALSLRNFIFTKVDECEQLGVLLNIHYKHDAPISFLTNGQRVPEDLLMPEPRAIAELIMNEHRIKDNG